VSRLERGGKKQEEYVMVKKEDLEKILEKIKEMRMLAKVS